MHSPLSVQDDAHLRDASGPAPLRTISMMPVMTSTGIRLGNAGRLDAGTGLDALAAPDARIQHPFDPAVKRCLERDSVHRSNPGRESPAQGSRYAA